MESPKSPSNSSNGPSSAPANVPQYAKPDQPGIAMNFDNSVSIYMIVGEADGFVDSARDAFALIKEAESRYPGWARTFYLDINGHRGEHHGYDADFLEFQQELFFSTMAPFLTAFDLPLTGPLLNPENQRNDLPDELVIGPAKS